MIIAILAAQEDNTECKALMGKLPTSESTKGGNGEHLIPGRIECKWKTRGVKMISSTPMGDSSGCFSGRVTISLSVIWIMS